jgi:hypothetical protein
MRDAAAFVSFSSLDDAGDRVSVVRDQKRPIWLLIIGCWLLVTDAGL